MPCGEPADAGDAVGFERGQRLFECGDAAKMRAVGAGAGHQLDMTIEQQRGASVLVREIMVRWSICLSRTSTAATSAAASKPGRLATSDDGSSTSGVAR